MGKKGIFSRILSSFGGEHVQLPATGSRGSATTPQEGGNATVAMGRGGAGADVSFRPAGGVPLSGGHGTAGDVSYVEARTARDGRTVRMSRGSKQLILIMADGSPSMEGMLAGVSRGVSALVSCLGSVADRVMVGGVVWSDSPRLVVPITQVDR